MRVLIINSNGMVGHVVALYFIEHGHIVLGYDDTLSNCIPTEIGQLNDFAHINLLLSENQFDAVINCSAIINQDAEFEKAKAVLINSYLPHFLEHATLGTNTIVVHRSTDCIFSGKRGRYSIDDTPDEISFYAKSKVLGELNNDKDITIRTSLIGPELIESGRSLFNWFIKKNCLEGFANTFWTGLSTIEFARQIENLLILRASGLFQIVPTNAISKYSLLLLFEKYFPNNRDIICSESNRVDKSLIQNFLGYDITIPDYESMIQDMRDWIYRHRYLYVHYNLENIF